MNFEVNLFIETTLHGPSVRNGQYSWVVEFTSKNGTLVTREGFGQQYKTSENKLVLTALSEAFSILTKPCSVRVFTKCEHILCAYKNDWITKWEEQDWMNAKGKPVKNHELWKQITEITAKHTITLMPKATPHGYESWMQTEMERRKEE